MMRPAILAGMLLLLTALPLYGAVSTQSNQATVRVTAPANADTQGDLQVQVEVSAVNNLGGFQFVLTADSAIVTPVSVLKGDFLGSSGREVFCLKPTIEGAAIRLQCVTLGPSPPGVTGSGNLATVTLKPEAAGTSVLTLSHVRLLDAPDGAEIPTTTQDAEMTVTKASDSSGTWWIVVIVVIAGGAVVIGGVGAIVVRRRSGASAPSQ